MNTLESLETYLAYQQYLATRQQTQATGQRGPLGAQDALGPDTSATDEWVPGQGSTRTPLYTDHERFRTAPDGTVISQRADGKVLLFSTAPDGSVHLFDQQANATTVFVPHSGQIDVQSAAASTTFDTPGSGPIVEHNADGSTTSFTLNADDSLSAPGQRWYDDGQSYVAVGANTQYLDTDGGLVHQIDASGRDLYYRVKGHDLSRS